MLIDMLKEAEQNAAATAPSPEEPAKLNPADRKVVELFIARLRRQIATEAAEASLLQRRPRDITRRIS
jgi:hypothetical protein